MKFSFLQCLNFCLFCNKEGCLKTQNCSWIKSNTNNVAKQLKAQIISLSKFFLRFHGVPGLGFLHSFFPFPPPQLACFARDKSKCLSEVSHWCSEGTFLWSKSSPENRGLFQFPLNIAQCWVCYFWMASFSNSDNRKLTNITMLSGNFCKCHSKINIYNFIINQLSYLLLYHALLKTIFPTFK